MTVIYPVIYSSSWTIFNVEKDGDDLNISQEDHAVHNLQNTQAQLLKQLEELEEDIKVNDEKARQYLKENKRQLAKTYLRKRHLLEKNHGRFSVRRSLF